MRPHNWEKFSFGEWLQSAAPRMHRNKLATALANKLARIAWSVLRTLWHAEASRRATNSHVDTEAGPSLKSTRVAASPFGAEWERISLRTQIRRMLLIAGWDLTGRRLRAEDSHFYKGRAPCMLFRRAPSLPSSA